MLLADERSRIMGLLEEHIIPQLLDLDRFFVEHKAVDERRLCFGMAREMQKALIFLRDK